MSNIEEKQPVAYRILSNSLMMNHVTHAYMIIGDNLKEQIEISKFLMKSIACEHTIACNDCDNCYRIDNDYYADMIIIDGLSKSIKKDDIIDVQEKFSKTALEISNKRFYMIKGIDNITISAANSLLKFLEEPRDDIYAIFLTDKPEKVISTIQSRVQMIKLKQRTHQDIYEQLTIENDLDKYLIANLLLKEHIDNDNLEEDENYQVSVFLFNKFKEYYPKVHSILFEIEQELGKKTINDRIVVKYLLDHIALFLKDVIYKNTICKDKKYIEDIQRVNSKNIENILSIVMESKDKLEFNVVVLLLVEQLYYRIKEELNEE